MIPVYAVLGHPNEGKSSVVATLAEDERVRISPLPGATTACESHALLIQGKACLHLIDTPGFQNPGAVLEAFSKHQGPEAQLIPAFLEAHAGDSRFHHDVELLKPLADRAAILYVCDPSRPFREHDRQEMEILRLTGLPRMALLNRKNRRETDLAAWQEAAARRFNLTRDFNAHKAGLPERLKLLDALRILTPEWDAPLQEMIRALRDDWQSRIRESSLILESLLLRAAQHQIRMPQSSGEAAALAKYQSGIRKLESEARSQWRALFRHGALPEGSPAEIPETDLFSKEVWELFGLSRRQLASIGAVTGSLLGLGADAATGGITFGILTLSGTVAGAMGGWFAGPRIGARRLPWSGGRTLAKTDLQVGPALSPQLTAILLDRSLLYLTELMHYAHARREPEDFLQALQQQKSLIADWSNADRKAYAAWFRAVRRSKAGAPLPELQDLLLRQLTALSPSVN